MKCTLLIRHCTASLLAKFKFVKLMATLIRFVFWSYPLTVLNQKKNRINAVCHPLFLWQMFYSLGASFLLYAHGTSFPCHIPLTKIRPLGSLIVPRLEVHPKWKKTWFFFLFSLEQLWSGNAPPPDGLAVLNFIYVGDCPHYSIYLFTFEPLA